MCSFHRFRWDIKRFVPDFSIYPVEGYITSGMEVTFDVTFHPQEISQDIRYDVRLLRNVLFNNTLNTFYLWLYGVIHMVVREEICCHHMGYSF